MASEMSSIDSTFWEIPSVIFRFIVFRFDLVEIFVFFRFLLDFTPRFFST